MPTQPELKRTLTLPLLTFYGLGTIIGAGIYVLVAKVAGHAGLYAPVAFLLAALLATFTGFSGKHDPVINRYRDGVGNRCGALPGIQRYSLETGEPSTSLEEFEFFRC